MGMYSVMSCLSKKQSVKYERLKDGLLFGSIQCHMNPPARKRASTRHGDLQETSVFDRWFYNLGTSIQICLLLVLQSVPGCCLHLLRVGIFILTRGFLFQKATMPWKLKFTYKSCSSV